MCSDFVAYYLFLLPSHLFFQNRLLKTSRNECHLSMMFLSFFALSLYFLLKSIHHLVYIGNADDVVENSNHFIQFVFLFVFSCIRRKNHHRLIISKLFVTFSNKIGCHLLFTHRNVIFTSNIYFMCSMFDIFFK